MPRTATVQLTTLRTCLVNLPLSLYGPLVERGTPPQSLVVELVPLNPSTSASNGKGKGKASSYVGWSGMPSTVPGWQQAQTDIIEMDPLLARELGFREGGRVSIELHPDVVPAQTVNVSPLSADDWEILEMHAEYVEANLLSQVRAAATGQTICVWVGKSRTLVRFSVDSVEPPCDGPVRLTNDTEVIVAPRTRQKPQVIPTNVNGVSPETTKRPADQLQRRLFRVVASECLASSSTTLLPSSSERVALVSPSSFAAIEKAHPSTRCSVKLAPRPRSASTSASAGSTQKKAVEVEAEPLYADGVEVWASRLVPNDHVWLADAVIAELKLPPVGKDGSSGFPLVRFTSEAPKPAKPTSPKATSKPLSNGVSSPKFGPLVSPSLAQASCPSLGSALETLGHDMTVRVDKSAEIDLSAPTTAELPLIGVDKELKQAVDHVLTALHTRRSHFATPGLLVCGSSGSGKSSFVRAVGHTLATDPRGWLHVQSIDCAKLTDERIPALKERLKEWLDEAHWHAPTLLVLDNLDRMVPAEVEHIDTFRAQHVAAIFTAALKAGLAERPVVLLATAQSTASLHAQLLSSHLIGERITLRAPDKQVRRQLLGSLVQGKAAATSLRLSNALDYVALATQTEGYLPADLRDLVDRAVHQAAVRANADEASLELAPIDFTNAQRDFVPLSLRDVKLQKSEVQWEDIGGLSETRKTLRETLEWPTKYSAIFANCPLRLRSGLLLYGFPGCGKTLLASAVAKECGLNFISVKGPELLNKYIGASEKSVRDLFDRAQAAKPCVLFFDEFDSIAPKRGHDSTGVTDRVVNQLLTQMDGAEGLDGVYVLAATSRPDLIDPALLRPGRLDKSLLCGMPSASERLEIMQACARKLALSDLVDLEEYAGLTQGFTGADLQALIYNAHLDALHASIADDAERPASTSMAEDVKVEYTTFGGKEGAKGSKVLSLAEKGAMERRLQTILASAAPQQTVSTATTTRAKTYIEPRHMRRALKTTRPSVPQTEVDRLRRIYDAFVSARSSDGGLPSGEASDQIGGRSSLM